MQKVELPINLINGILQYLGTKPFMEVADIVNAIRTEVLPQVQKEEDGRSDAPANL